MIATYFNIHEREVKSKMPYFEMFNRMFVHFHLYTTHEAVYDSLRDLNVRNHYFTTYCNVWPLYTTIFSSMLILTLYCLHLPLYTGPSLLHKIGISHKLSLTIK